MTQWENPGEREERSDKKQSMEPEKIVLTKNRSVQEIGEAAVEELVSEVSEGHVEL